MVAFLVFAGLAFLVWLYASGFARIFGPKGEFVDGDHEHVLAAIDRHLVRRDTSAWRRGLGLVPVGIVLHTKSPGSRSFVVIRSDGVEVRSKLPWDELRDRLDAAGLGAPDTKWFPGRYRTWAPIEVSEPRTAERLLETALETHRALSHAPTGAWRWLVDYPAGSYVAG